MYASEPEPIAVARQSRFVGVVDEECQPEVGDEQPFSPSNIKLAGFKSRCTTPMLWA